MHKKSHRESIKEKITNGRYVEYRGLSICKINDFYPLANGKTKYQVHSYYFSELYDNIDEALDRFFEIRWKIR